MAPARPSSGSVVTIGNFDGVHLGHQEIIRETIAQARAAGRRAVAFTFRPHPQAVLRPDRAPPLLLTYDEKREILLSLGLDEVVEQPFAAEFAATPPEAFFNDVLRGRLDARAIVVGYDFTFGRERSGHLQILEHLCIGAKASLTVVPPRRVDAEVVSSSVIRSNLGAGRVADAGRGMGRPFFYRGTVSLGDQRGRNMGFPTANFPLEAISGGKLVLPFGVYATRLTAGGFPSLPAVTNVGVRPTFAGDSQGAAPVLVETHILDGSHELYSQQVVVEFVERIRGERKFSSIAELQAQIAADIARARQILA